MNVIPDLWNNPWEWRKNRKQKNKSCVKSIVDFQYNGEGKIPDRDTEMVHLQCQEYYSVPQLYNEPRVPIFCCKFCRMPAYNNIVAAADENGNVSLHNVDKFEEVNCFAQAHDNAVFDLTWVPNDSKFLTLSGDHTARLWDCGQGSIRLLSVFCGHHKSVKTADFRINDPAVFATGSRDGTVMVWDSRSRTKGCPHIYAPDQAILRAAADQCKTSKKASITSVTAVVYQDENSLVCAGSADPYIRIWDMRKTHSHYKGSEPKIRLKAKRSGFSDLKFNPERTKLYASCLNSSIFCFNLNSCSSVPIAEYNGHQNGSFYVKTCVSRDGRYLLSGSSDKMLYVWKTKDGERQTSPCQPFLTFDSHLAEVTGVDINQIGYTTMVTCADDGTLRKWRPVFKNDNIDSKETEALTHNLETLNITGELRERDEREFIGSSSGPVDVNREDMLIIQNLESTEKEAVTQQPILMTPPSKTLTVELTRSKRKIRDCSPDSDSSPRSKRPVLSPTKHNSKDLRYSSPTINLPNYVLDGTGPHHRCSRSRQKENVDWLTQIRRSSSKSVDRSWERPVSGEKRTEGRAKKLDFRTLGNGKKPSSRRTLLEYYKKSSKVVDESITKTSDTHS